MDSPIRAYSRPENPSSSPAYSVWTFSFLSSNRIPESPSSSDDTLYRTPTTWSLSFWVSNHHLNSKAKAKLNCERGTGFSMHCLAQPKPISIIINQTNQLVPSYHTIGVIWKIKEWNERRNTHFNLPNLPTNKIPTHPTCNPICTNLQSNQSQLNSGTTTKNPLPTNIQHPFPHLY